MLLFLSLRRHLRESPSRFILRDDISTYATTYDPTSSNVFSRVHGACRCRNRDNSYQASGARGKRTLHPGPRLVFLDLDPQDLNTHSWRDPALPHTHTFPQAEFYAIPLRIPGVLLHRCTESRARVLVPDLEIIPSWEHGGIIQGNLVSPPTDSKISLL